MPFFQFLGSIFYTALLTPPYLRWSRDQAEAQIDKMQQAVFNTPGVESPAPPVVIIAGAALLVSHFLVGQTVLRLSRGVALLSLIIGATIGIFRFIGTNEPES